MKDKKIVDYIIINNETRDSVIMQVLNRIKDGYVPLGGVSMAVESGDLTRTYTYFSQAMVKYSDN